MHLSPQKQPGVTGVRSEGRVRDANLSVRRRIYGRTRARAAVGREGRTRDINRSIPSISSPGPVSGVERKTRVRDAKIGEETRFPIHRHSTAAHTGSGIRRERYIRDGDIRRILCVDGSALCVSSTPCEGEPADNQTLTGRGWIKSNSGESIKVHRARTGAGTDDGK